MEKVEIKKTKINLPSGLSEVSAAYHPFCKGLSVTGHRFGLFRVCHNGSGNGLGDDEVTLQEAVVSMMGFELLARRVGFSWEASSNEIHKIRAEKAHEKVALFEGDEPLPWGMRLNLMMSSLGQAPYICFETLEEQYEKFESELAKMEEGVADGAS